MAGALLKYNGQALQTPSGAYGINNLVPENVKSGVNIGGVVGTYSGATPTLLHITRTATGSVRQYLTINDVPKKPIYIAIKVKGTINNPTIIQFVNSKTINEDVVVLYRDNNGTFETMEATFTYSEEYHQLLISSGTNNFMFYGASPHLVDIIYYE